MDDVADGILALLGAWVSCRKSCARCGCAFGVTRYRHHCRHCGESFCQEHSPFRHPIPKLGHLTPARVCHACKVGGQSGHGPVGSDD